MNNYNGQYIILFFILLSQIGITQVASLNLKWEEEEEVFFSGKLHRLQCEVTTPNNQKVKLIIKPESPLRLLSPSSYKINSKKDEKHSSAIKIYLPQTGDNNKDSLRCNFILQSLEDETILATGELCYEIKEQIAIRMEPLRPQVPIKATDTLTILPLKVNNMGNRQYRVKISLKSSAKSLKFQEYSKEFLLNKKTDTLINFAAQPERGWQKVYSADLSFTLETLKDGEEVADCSISAFPLGHTKKFSTTQFSNNNVHSYNLGFQNRGKNNKVLELSATGNKPYNNGFLKYSFQSFYYSSSKEFQIFNSYVRYYKGSKSLTLGSINYQGELSLSGRGIMYQNERDSQYVQFGYFNGANKLFEPSWGSNTSTGNSFAGEYGKKTNKFGLLGISGVIKLRENSKTGLFQVSSTFENIKDHLKFQFGVSGQNDKTSLINKSFLPGVSLGANVNKNFKTWNYQSSNHISSQNYAGNGSGSLRSSNKINYRGWQYIKMGASMRYQKSKRFLLIGDQVHRKSSEFQKFQFQFETKNTGKWKLILTPYQTSQKQNILDKSQPDNYFIGKSNRLRTSLNYRGEKLSVGWSGNAGWYKYAQKGFYLQKTLSYQSGFNVSWKDINLNSSFNYGPSFLSDALKYEESEKKISNFLLGLRWQKIFFDRKLKLIVNNQLTHSAVRQQWVSTSTLKAESKISKGLTVNGEFFFFKTSTYNEQFWNLKLSKKLANYRPPSGSKNLRITLYEDSNNSGKREDSERILPGIFVQVNRIPFITNGRGLIQYKSIPMGEYKINIVDPTGNLAAERQVAVVEDNTKIEIPLYKTGVLIGMVKEIKQKFKSARFELLGLPIVAKNPQDDIYMTYTQPDGSFAFNLPENEYTVYIDTRALGSNFELPDNYQKIILKQNEKTEISLSVKVKGRKMKIQKF